MRLWISYAFAIDINLYKKIKIKVDWIDSMNDRWLRVPETQATTTKTATNKEIAKNGFPFIYLFIYYCSFSVSQSEQFDNALFNLVTFLLQWLSLDLNRFECIRWGNFITTIQILIQAKFSFHLSSIVFIIFSFLFQKTSASILLFNWLNKLFVLIISFHFETMEYLY